MKVFEDIAEYCRLDPLFAVKNRELLFEQDSQNSLKTIEVINASPCKITKRDQLGAITGALNLAILEACEEHNAEYEYKTKRLELQRDQQKRSVDTKVLRLKSYELVKFIFMGVA
ncbi:hypothetical protein PHMEG_00032319 [Phytophthora megakarya]|uniref:Uncharacterized protein n=1 Tax=Phytophthora megakarya TaxID=4795 RepID=A0A225UYE8_9STRA|nr:hypothetical protein PHMEG_00032319 [Phytophthora megakarya]